jgi:DNA-binding XRE family transcriptional regulator
MMSKAELARKAGLSTLTIDRVEAGRACRLDTKRKILQALGMKISDKAQVFGALTSQPSTEGRQEPVAESVPHAVRDEASYIRETPGRT